jgi:hypothetical protein
MNIYSLPLSDAQTPLMTSPDPRGPDERSPKPAPARDNEHPDPNTDRPATDPDERINEDAEREAREEAGTEASALQP